MDHCKDLASSRGYQCLGHEVKRDEPTAERPFRFDQALIHFGLGETDQAFEWLEKSYVERSWHLGLLKSQPIFKSIRSDPRFADLLRRMKLPQ